MNDEGALMVDGTGGECGPLPAFKASSPVFQSGNTVPEPLMMPTGNEHILFVDDEELLVELSRQMLQLLEYQVTAVGSSWEALDLFTKNADQFDLIITDQTMPKMTGVELAEKMLSIRPDIPIILSSGFGETFQSEWSGHMGICSFLLKPYGIKQIAHTIRDVLDAGLNLPLEREGW